MDCMFKLSKCFGNTKQICSQVCLYTCRLSRSVRFVFTDVFSTLTGLFWRLCAFNITVSIMSQIRVSVCFELRQVKTHKTRHMMRSSETIRVDQGSGTRRKQMEKNGG